MSDPPIRVLCVDDHRLMREGIVRTINVHRDIVVVAEASSGLEAVKQFHLHRPDVTLMDLQLPGMNGLTAIETIRQSDAAARIVVLTMYDGDEDIFRALQAGAAGYILKDTVPEVVIRVVREVHAGQQSIPPDVAAKLAARMTHPTLTPREEEVLTLMSRGLRNKEIASTLRMSEDTARAHIKSIFVKFDVHDRVSALGEAVRRGIVHLTPPRN